MPPAIEELKWTDADFAEYDAGPAADGQDAGRMVVRRPRRRIQERRARARRDVRRRRTPATRRSSRARRWRTGRTASCTSTARRRASCRRSASMSRWLHLDAERRRRHQRVHRRRIRQQGDRARSRRSIPALLSKKPNAPVMMRIDRETSTTSAARGPAVHGRAEGRLREGRPHHRARHVRRQRERSVRAGRRHAA